MIDVSESDLEQCIYSILYADDGLPDSIEVRDLKDVPTAAKNMCYVCNGDNYNCPGYRTLKDYYVTNRPVD
jgi:hypothetical protein